MGITDSNLDSKQQSAKRPREAHPKKKPANSKTPAKRAKKKKKKRKEKREEEEREGVNFWGA